MSGIFGYVGAGTPAIAEAMARAAGRGDGAGARMSSGSAHAIGAMGLPRNAFVLERGDHALALYGHPFLERAGRRITTIGEVAAALLERLQSEGRAALASLGGDFALAYADAKRACALLATDRMGIRNVTYAVAPGTLVFGPDCDTAACHPAIGREIDPQQIYNYLYFHMVPGPATIYRRLQRIPPGHCVEFERGGATVHRYWQMSFDEPGETHMADLRPRFRAALDTAVATYAQPGSTGTFLSGGTDSSTVAGVLAQPGASRDSRILDRVQRLRLR